ncbi:MAG: T9SS type A sorting domain-containing protein, partial [Ignavibacteriaceae bacterium]
LVTLKVYNILGQEVATLVNQGQQSGSYTVNFDASRLASGIYMYRIQAGNFSQTKKMTLLK